VSIARARVETSVTTRWHRLRGIAERYVIIEGLGRVEVGDLPATDVGPGDVVLIPPGCRQRIANIGSTDLVFLAICSPRFVPEAYWDINPADQA
jgi:mannose-6-phosphate isomerase-like protein (cupin superfamily)